MDAQAPVVFLRCFSGLTDPRRHNVRHLFTDILAIAILAVMCRADDWDEVVLYGTANLQWLATFLELPNGIPSADTFSRLFARLNPESFEKCFIEWTRSLAGSSDGRLVAIDGKSLRRSFMRGWNRQMVHMVSAWCGENELTLGQLAVKGNQKTLHKKVGSLLNDIALDQAKGLTPGTYDYCEKTESGHGRDETRRVWVTTEVKSLGEELLGQWSNLNSVIMVENTRQNLGDSTGKISVERHLYISSLQNPSAQQAGQYVRGHWGIENKLHGRLDMCHGEDESRIRKDHGAENFSRLRRIALNKLKSDPAKLSLKNKRYKCSLDREYLLKTMQQ
jgi:predicted transposase YbfD/YdcC